MSIDGLTIMINVKRKKQKASVKQSVVCTGTKRPCSGCHGGVCCPGRVPRQHSLGKGWRVRSQTQLTLASSLLAALDFNYQIAGLGVSGRSRMDPASPLNTA